MRSNHKRISFLTNPLKLTVRDCLKPVILSVSPTSGDEKKNGQVTIKCCSKVSSKDEPTCQEETLEGTTTSLAVTLDHSKRVPK